MFANFEICKAGLVSSTPSRRCRRTTTGCLQCRKRKKKCDERRPTCSLCLKYDTICERVRNSRQSSPASYTSSSPEGDLPLVFGVSADTASSVYATDLMDLSDSLSGNPDSADPPLIQTQRKSKQEQPSISIGSNVRSLELLAFSLPSEHQALALFLEKINALTMPRYINPRLSILHSTLPIAVASPAMKNALMACGFALMSQTSLSTNDRLQAKSYQCKALRQLAENICHGFREENLATILLLHVYEKIACESVQSKRLHLLGANRLIGISPESRMSRSGATKLYAYLLEVYAYHIAVSSTFSSTSSPPFPMDHVSKLLTLLEKASGHPNTMWKDSSLMGVSHGIFDVIYRSSLLRRQMPLSEENKHYAQELREMVLDWQWDCSKGNNAEHSGNNNNPRPPEEMIGTGRLYRLACLLLLEKILTPSIQAGDQVPRYLAVEFCEIIRQLSPEVAAQPVHLWPLLIMGTAAQTQDERDLFLAPLQHSPKTFGFGSRIQGYTFLTRSWAAGPSSDAPLGLDILLRDDLLSEIFI